MNAPFTKGLAIAPDAAPPPLGLRPEPFGLGHSASVDYRDTALSAQLEAIRNRAHALRLAWAMQGLCKRAEQAGVDVSYYRDLAAEIEGKIR